MEIVFPKPPEDLPEEDRRNLPSDWHRREIGLLIESIRHHFRDRRDFFAGGNMFIYYCVEQAHDQSFRGPDFFFASDVIRDRSRRYWAVWEEGGKYPDVILELLAPETAAEDRAKKEIYERRFRTPEYFLYDPDARVLEGWRMGSRSRFRPITPDERGWLWSEELELWLGHWRGPYQWQVDDYLRFYQPDGDLVLIGYEYEKQQTEVAEAELKRLRALLRQLKPDSGQ